MRSLGIPRNILQHTSAVSQLTTRIGKSIQQVPVDLEVVEIGAILHDVGRCKTHGLEHAMAGGEILRAEGFDARLARIAETHVLGGLTKADTIQAGLPPRYQHDYLPTTVEEKIVCYADKRYSGRRKVTIQQRFNRWFQKNGRTQLLEDSLHRVRVMEEELNNLML